MKSGIGFDIHRLVKNRKLIIGGVKISFPKGLLGHSDGDVLIHSIIDAILGALNYGDIGKLFPDTEDKYKDTSSIILLEKVQNIVKNKRFKIEHIDATIIAEEPKFQLYIPQMKKVLAQTLKISVNKISIKAKTMEGLGEIGKGRAIASLSIVNLEKGNKIDGRKS